MNAPTTITSPQMAQIEALIARLEACKFPARKGNLLYSHAGYEAVQAMRALFSDDLAALSDEMEAELYYQGDERDAPRTRVWWPNYGLTSEGC